MAQKSKWTGQVSQSMQVLNHAEKLRLEKFRDDELAQIADCDDVYRLELYSSRTQQPVDLSCLAHITSLRCLSLERVKFTNLKALQQLPHLSFLIIDNCDFKALDELNGWPALKTLFLYRNKLKVFAPGLDLPQLGSLLMNDEQITDLGFVASYPQVTDLNVGYNGITNLSALACCTWLERLNVRDNPIATLAPLAGMRFKRLVADNALSTEMAQLQLELPEPPYERDASSIEASRIARLIESKDWPQVYAIDSLDLLGEAFSYVVHGHADAEMIQGALAHPAPGAFETLIIKGLRPDSISVLKLVEEIFSSHGELLIAPLTQAFQKHLEREGYEGEFNVGKFEQEHCTIAGILEKVAAPPYTELFLAFFAQRE